MDALGLDKFRYTGKRRSRLESEGDSPSGDFAGQKRKRAGGSQSGSADDGRGRRGEGAADLTTGGKAETEEEVLAKWRKFADPALDEEARNFHIVVAVLLSKQTHPRVLRSAMDLLHSKGLNVRKLAEERDEDELRIDIRTVHYNRQKAMQVKQTAKLILEKGKVPTEYDELVKLPGIGPTLAKILAKVLYT